MQLILHEHLLRVSYGTKYGECSKLKILDPLIFLNVFGLWLSLGNHSVSALNPNPGTGSPLPCISPFHPGVTSMSWLRMAKWALWQEWLPYWLNLHAGRSRGHKVKSEGRQMYDPCWDGQQGQDRHSELRPSTLVCVSGESSSWLCHPPCILEFPWAGEAWVWLLLQLCT